MASLKEVKVYPTVCDNELYVENGSNTSVNYTIVSMSGATTINGKAANGKTTVDVSNLPAGVYTMQVSSDKVRKAIKFTKM